MLHTRLLGATLNTVPYSVIPSVEIDADRTDLNHLSVTLAAVIPGVGYSNLFFGVPGRDLLQPGHRK